MSFNLEKYTSRTQKILMAGRKVAKNFGHQSINPEHLLLAMVDDTNVQKILKHMKAKPATLAVRLKDEIAKSPRVSVDNQYLSNSLRDILASSEAIAARFNCKKVEVGHLLIAFSDDEVGVGPAGRFVRDLGLTKAALESTLKNAKGRSIRARPVHNAAPTYDPESALGKFAIDLTAKAEAGGLNPIIGRSTEIRRIIEILCRSTKNNPVLVGEPGVGKTAVIEALAQRIANRDVPTVLLDKRVMVLELSSLLAGASLRGQFEERIRDLVSEIKKASGSIILFVDEVHTLVGAGGEGASDASNMLKPALARGEVQILGSTTPDEYRNSIEKDKALSRRFQPLSVEEPNDEQALSILRGIKSRFEVHHGVRITDDALQAAVDLSNRYISDNNLPDKAIDLVDNAASRLRVEIDSVPAELDKMDRIALRIKMEISAMSEEITIKAKEAKIELGNKLENIEREAAKMRSAWENELQLIRSLRALKEELAGALRELEAAEKSGSIDQAADIQNSTEVISSRIDEVTAELDSIQYSLIKEEVRAEDIAAVIGDLTGIPVATMLEGELEKLRTMEDRIGKRVISQREAIGSIATAIRRSRAGINDPNRPVGSFFFLGPTGTGKCLAPNTDVLTASGATIKARDIKKGMSLMGPDSQPRKVLSTTIGHGPMYRIKPVKGDPWECNDVHVLTLVHATSGMVKDVPLDEYLKWSKTQKYLWKQYSVGANFPEQAPLAVDPYFLGLWAGDETKSLESVSISKDDEAVVSACYKIAEQWDCTVSPDKSNSCTTWHIVNNKGQSNPLLDKMRGLMRPSISSSILTASKAERFEFLAGCIDSDGHLDNNSFEVIHKDEKLAEAITFVARSLGYKVVISYKYVNDARYVRSYISGHTALIPTRIPRKQASESVKNEDACRTGFEVEQIADGEYSGFTLDGDGRFLLGDFTVTHNTELAKALAEFLFDDEQSMIRFDMSEFMEKHTVARLIGAPPGYKGADDGGQLTEAVRQRPYSVVLFDEVEKAHPDLFNILLQILDDGRLTDAQGTLVDFKNTVIIMTSNVGSHHLLESTMEHGEVTDGAKELALADLRKSFRPEFLGRIDETVTFHGLTRNDISSIADIQLAKLCKLLKNKGLDLEFTEEARSDLVDKGFEPAYGARPLRRALQRHLQNPLAHAILESTFDHGDTILVSLKNDKLEFSKKPDQRVADPLLGPYKAL